MIHRIQSRILFPGLASAVLVCGALPSCGEADCLDTKTCTKTQPSTGGSRSFGGSGGLTFAPAATKGGAATAGAAPTSGGEAGGDSGEYCSDEGERQCAAAAGPTILECSGGVWVVAETCARGELCDSTEADCATIAPGCERFAPGGAFCEDNELVVCGPDLVTVKREACAGGCASGACVGDGSGGAPGGSGGSSNPNGGSNEAGGVAGSAATDSGAGSGNEAGAPVSNPCSPNPCGANRTCIDEEGGYRCECAPGTTGTDCTPVVEDLGAPPPGYDRCDGYMANADGSVVIGVCKTQVLDYHAFRWTASEGLRILNQAEGHTTPWDVTADGAVVIGMAREGTEDTYPFRWTEANGMTNSGSNGPVLFSDDGAAEILYDGSRRTVSGTQSLTFTPVEISGDGNVVVGYKETGGTSRAYKWVSGSGVVELPAPAGMINPAAKAVSGEGAIIGGRAERDGVTYGVIWRGTTAESGCGLREHRSHRLRREDVERRRGTALLTEKVWKQDSGLQPILELLSDAGATVDEDTFDSFRGLSANGRFIVGYLRSTLSESTGEPSVPGSPTESRPLERANAERSAQTAERPIRLCGHVEGSDRSASSWARRPSIALPSADAGIVVLVNEPWGNPSIRAAQRFTAETVLEGEHAPDADEVSETPRYWRWSVPRSRSEPAAEARAAAVPRSTRAPSPRRLQLDVLFNRAQLNQTQSAAYVWAA